jgi:hypothetical protein
MTFPQPSANSGSAAADVLAGAPLRRQKQIRVLLSIEGNPRLPPHKAATWSTSSLFTFSPATGLIASHEVEAIRPLPGESVAEWLGKALGFSRAGGGGGAVPCPRTARVELDHDPIVRVKE